MSRRLTFWLGVGAVLLALVVSVASLALLARNTGSALVAGAVERNSAAIGTALRIQFEKALLVGMELHELVGVDAVFTDYLERHHEVSFFALMDDRGQPILAMPSAQLGATVRTRIERQLTTDTASLLAPDSPFQVTQTPIAAPNGAAPAGMLLTGYPRNYIDQQVNAMVLDLFVAVLIAVILVAEFLRYAGLRFALNDVRHFRIFAQRLAQGLLGVRSVYPGNTSHDALDPLHRLGQTMNRRLDTLRERHTDALRLAPPQSALRQRLQDWADRHQLHAPISLASGLGTLAQLRLVVFLTALSDEMIRPFFAVHITHLQGPLTLSNEVLAGIPLSTFLLTWAISQPFGVSLLRRWGAGPCLAGASALVGVGLLATAPATNWWAVTALRGITGLGFGFVLIFSQTLMLRLGREGGRASAIAEFVGAVVAAGICGPVVGGLVADKLGTSGALMVAGLVALAALVLAWRVADTPSSTPTGSTLSLRSLRATLGNGRLVMLLAFSSIPGKLIATAVLLMVVPLAVADMGESPALAGRLLLLYFLGFLLVAGLAGRLSDRWKARKPFVALGGMLTAAGCMAGYSVGGTWGLALLCGLTGLGQAWLSSPQIVLATQLANQQGSGVDGEIILGIYRLMERFGGALGPVLAAHLVQRYQLHDALLGLGVAMAVGSVLTIAALWSLNERPTARRANPA